MWLYFNTVPYLTQPMTTAVHDVQLSKTLAWVLRHQAVKHGLDIREDGYVPCHQVVEFLAKRCIPGMTQARLKGEVDACPKRRVELTPCENYIRASRGHSIRSVEDVRLLQEVVDASTVRDAVYGTSSKSWEVIRETGLSRGHKNHICIATRDSKSGYSTADSNVLIYIDVAQAISDGITFFVATNGCILTRGVNESGMLPSKYFLRVVFNRGDGDGDGNGDTDSRQPEEI